MDANDLRKRRAVRTLSTVSVQTTQRGVRRNQPCPCRSGKSYKKCCGAAKPAAKQPHQPPKRKEPTR